MTDQKQNRFNIVAILFGIGCVAMIGSIDAFVTPKVGWIIESSHMMRVTAYCPCEKCCREFADGITACNHMIVPGDKFVAADKRYPFGTVFIIPGYNDGRPVEVLDRGGAIKGDKLDVFFDSHQQAIQWGVKFLEVKIIKL